MGLDNFRDLERMRYVLLLSGGALAVLSFTYPQLLFVSLPAAAAGVLLGKAHHGSAANRITEYRDLENALESLTGRYRETGNLPLALKGVSPSGYAFSGELNRAINAFSVGHDPAAFEGFDRYSGLTREFANILEKGLSTGENVTAHLDELLGRVRSVQERLGKGIGIVSNTVSVNGMGSALFFPLFAGVSIDIIKFAGALATQQQSGSITTELIAMFVSYILISNYINARFGPRQLSSPQLSMVLATAAMGLVAFRLAALLISM